MSDSDGERQSQATEQHSEPEWKALQASLPPAVAAASSMVVQSDGRGSLLSRILESPEARRHRNVEEATRHVAVEVVLANSCVGTVAGNVLAVTLETERGFQETVIQYKDCVLAMAVAPTAIDQARRLYTGGIAAVSQAGIEHIKQKIAHR